MHWFSNIRREPLMTLVATGLGLGLLFTALAWVFPGFAKGLFGGAGWLWALILLGTYLILTGVRRAEECRYPHVPRPAYILAVVTATTLVYLFPELFAPGCGGVPRAFAACPAACRITTCVDWDAPGENGCNAKPPDKGCCRAYATTCDPNCEEPDPTPVPSYQPPTVSGNVNCATLGTNGWCKGGAMLNLSASDPQGFPTTLSGEIAGVAFTCSGPHCAQTIPTGSGTIHFQAWAASSGLSSNTGSASFAFDPMPPTANLVISGVAGNNGWYTSASVTANGTDLTSGLALTQVAVDDSPWQAAVVLPEGIHSVVGRALDRAGNVNVTPIQMVRVDATVPAISASVTEGTLVADWYVTDVNVVAQSADATSGLALVEYRIDDGNWSPGDSLVVTHEGWHTIDFRATDQAGLRSTTSLSVQIDQTPPVVTFMPAGTSGANGWYTSPVALQVNASDAFSGLATLETRLDGGSWMSSTNLTLSDGEHGVEARATDQAGNLSSVETLDVRVDTTAPSLTTTLSGTLGLADWYVSDVMVLANALDDTSGIVLTEYRLDNGSWQAGTGLTVSSDGLHTVDFRTTDHAGNQAFASLKFRIDQTLPVSRFVSPADGSSGTMAQGLFTLEGQSIDATSGLAAVQISTDRGFTWSNISTSPTGDWQIPWETKPLPNGPYPVFTRAQDVAGNLQSAAQVTLLLANHPPRVHVQESWWVWEAGRLRVEEHFFPVQEIRVRIACLDGQPDVKLNFTLTTLPPMLKWDRKCGQGQFATAGDHVVTLTACDQIGHCASATGTIKVPFLAPPLPSWTPTSAPFVTSTPLPTAPAYQPAATLSASLIQSTPKPPEESSVTVMPFRWSWLFMALVSLWVVFAGNGLLDPRPRALQRLSTTWQKLVEQAREYPRQSGSMY